MPQKGLRKHKGTANQNFRIRAKAEGIETESYSQESAKQTTRSLAKVRQHQTNTKAEQGAALDGGG